MTNQLENYRKSISYYKSKGYDDFKTLNLLKTNKNGKFILKGGDGGYSPTEKEVELIQKYINIIPEGTSGLDDLKNIISQSPIVFPDKSSFAEVENRLIQLARQKITPDEDMEIADDQAMTDQAMTDQTMGNQTQSSLETLESGTILYHPSIDVRQFSSSMIFVKMQDVLDQSKQRSFTMFFTPNEEYAKRYSGIWSLNKKPVYVHKLMVKNGIKLTGIKKINSNDIANVTDNIELGKNICGDSVDGFINGIKVEHPTNDGSNVAEYYICNPSQWFEHLETWMQTSPTEWVSLSNKQTIGLNSTTNTNNTQLNTLDEGLATDTIDNLKGTDSMDLSMDDAQTDTMI